MQTPAKSLQAAWIIVPGEHPALHFAPPCWRAIRALANRRGAPSPQEFVARIVGDLIQLNARVNPSELPRIKLEWVTHGQSAAKADEALLAFHTGTLRSIAALWARSEVDTKEWLCGALLASLGKSMEPRDYA